MDIVMRNIAQQKIHDAYRLIARHVYGDRGGFVYRAFDFINTQYFDEQVSEPLIVWDLTDHGRFLGWCRSPEEGAPIIKIHPATYSPTGHLDGNGMCLCWGGDIRLFGPCYSFDVLLHECMHAHINYNLGGVHGCQSLIGNGPTATPSLWDCHNCPNWINECNRIGRLLGLNVDAQMTCVGRRPVPGVFTQAGKPKTKPVRTRYGNLKPEHFPHCMPERKTFYLNGVLPF